VINLDKPKGMTSQDAVTRVKRILKVKKAGHAGTLDPLATGVLVVCTGEATKITRFLMAMDKEYAVQMKLGERTDTFDSEGTVIERRDGWAITREMFEAALPKYRGTIMQTPPMYSALKRNGRPLYELAREGIEVEREARELQVTLLEVTEFAPPLVSMIVRCSKGTYIRSLVDDIGTDLGTLAHMTELRRTGVGIFSVSASIPPENLMENESLFYSPDQSLGMMKEVVLDINDYRLARHGGAIKSSKYALLLAGDYVRLKSPEGLLLGVGNIDTQGMILIERLLNLT